MDLTVRAFEKDAKPDIMQVSETTFGQGFNESLIHQVVIACLAKARAGTHAQKTRAEVRGGGAKPYRQKGTGRARAGTIRSPLWRGGGRSFAAKPGDYSQKVNKKMYRAAMRSILSELMRQGRLCATGDILLPEPKTSQLIDLLAQLKPTAWRNVLIITTGESRNLDLSARNIPTVRICNADNVSPVDLIRADGVLATEESIRRLEEKLV